MALRPIVYDGDPVLRKKAVEVKNVDGLLVQLLDDMVETMYSANGIGLAAPQIGLSKRVLVADVGDGPIKAINPKITAREGTVWGLEGCLSIPRVYGEVERAEKVTVKYMDEKGKPQKLECEGLMARVFQHEIDHLDGKLFIDNARNVKEYTEEELAELGDPERAEPEPVRG
ncbi:MAG TPA: peptide deformylase [Candidatus Xenobia bacterium]|jgi:peptide deformylase